MSDEALEQEFADELEQEQEPAGEPEAEPAAEPASESAEEPQYSETEEKARAGGWRPKDEWEGEPDEWISAAQFNRFGELFDGLKESKGKLTAVEQSYEQQLALSNKINSQQKKLLENRIEQLKSDRTAAIDLADTTSADQIQGQIDDINGEIANLDAAPTTPTTEKSEVQAVVNWNADNPWIKENTPKAAFAHSEYIRIARETAINNPTIDAESLGEAAIKGMEASVAKAFPAKNPNRDRPAASAKGKNSQKRSSGDTLTMAQLTTSEREVWHEMKDAYKDEAEFLSAVQASRVGAE